MSQNDMTRPAGAVVPVTAGVAIVPPDGYVLPARALLVGTAGTATLTDGAGKSRANVPLQQGYNPIQVMAIDSASASDIWALF